MKSRRPVTGPKWLDERLLAGGVVVIDGATGSELQRRGVPMHDDAWCGAAMFEHGETLQAVHESYLQAGAEVIIANTFATSRQVLEPAGMGSEVAKINREAVAVAARARDAVGKDHVAIAGSISDFRPNADTAEWTSEPRLRATMREQAEILAEAGVDLLALEMMQEPEIAVPTIEEALATGLPVWAGISCSIVPGRKELGLYDLPERLFSETLGAVIRLNPAVINIMHSHVPAATRAIDEVRRSWSGPLGVYPNSGYYERPTWQFIDIIPPDEFAATAAGWLDRGIQLIGGCCGIGPVHIQRLSERIAA